MCWPNIFSHLAAFNCNGFGFPPSTLAVEFFYIETRAGLLINTTPPLAAVADALTAKLAVVRLSDKSLNPLT